MPLYRSLSRPFSFAGLLCTFFLISTARGAVPEEHLSSYTFIPQNETELANLAHHYEVRRAGEKTYEVILPQAEAKNFERKFPRAQIQEFDLQDYFRQIDRDPNWRAAYRTFDQVVSTLQGYEKNYPAIAKLFKYGVSKQGKPLYALRIAPSSGNPPEIMLTAATHGDEIITVEVLLGVLDRLVRNYGKDERITRLVDKHQILFIPVVNPDGFSRRQRYDNGVDPNRSYPWPRNPNLKGSSSIGPLMAFFGEHKVAASIDFHAYGRYVMYPWGYTRAAVDGAAGSQLREVSQMMSKMNGYRAGQISQIMYIAPGSSADYYYWKGRTIALGIEMARSKAPSPSQIPGVLAEILEPTLKFIEQF